MTIQPLAKKDRKAAAQAVANAFYDYPSLIAYFPIPKSGNASCRGIWSGCLQAR